MIRCLPLLLLCTSCALNVTYQTAHLADGSKRRTVTWTATLLDASSSVTKQRTTNTEKSQSSSVGTISDASDSESLKYIVEGVIEGLKKP